MFLHRPMYEVITLCQYTELQEHIMDISDTINVFFSSIMHLLPVAYWHNLIMLIKDNQKRKVHCSHMHTHLEP